MKHRHNHIIEEKNKAIASRFLRLAGENHVFEYDNCYYKFPNYPKLFYGSSDPYRTICGYIRIVEKYFGADFRIARTTVHRYKRHYFLKQEKIVGEKIAVSALAENPELRHQLSHLMDINDRLWEECGLYLDLLGTDAATNPSKIHNLLFDGKRIVIFDFGFINRKSTSFVFAKLSLVFHDVQRFYVRKLIENFQDDDV